ncbi:MAG: iron chaperone [Clostridia bacterium]
MKDFNDFLDTIEESDKRARMEMIFNHIREKFPQLKEEIKWNQPMFTDHGTFIIAFSIAKGHIAVAPEGVVIKRFEKEIEDAGYSHTRELFRIKWTDEVNWELIDKIIEFNMEDKKDMTKFWR